MVDSIPGLAETTIPKGAVMKITQRTTKLELAEILKDLPDYMVAAGEIIGVLKNRIHDQDYGPYRSVDDQRRRTLELVTFHFRLKK